MRHEISPEKHHFASNLENSSSKKNISYSMDHGYSKLLIIKHTTNFFMWHQCTIDYKISIQDVINSSKKTTDEWGIKGYTIPKFNARLDHSPTFIISKSKPNNFISDITKKKNFIPGPQYEVGGSMLLKTKMSFPKLPRITAVH